MRKRKKDLQAVTFQAKLEREFLKRFYVILFSSFLVVLLSSVSFYFINIYSSMQTERKQIAESYEKMKASFESKIESMSTELVLSYIEGTANERDLYTKYYEMMAVQNNNIQGRFLIIDKNYSPLFDSGKEWHNSNKFTNYLKAVYSHAIEDREITERVYVSQEKIHYLVLSKKIMKNGELKGYLAVLVDGRSFYPTTNLTGVNYYLYDKYDNIFAMSSSYFVEGNLEKLSDEVQTPIKYRQGELVLAVNSQVSKNLSLVVFKKETSIFMISLFLLFSTLLICLAAVIPIKHISKKFAENNSKNVALISEEMEKVGENRNYRFKIESNDEFSDLAQNINEMLDRIDRLFENNLELVKENALSERKKLEAQFDPHFLYNTLEVIRISTLYDPKLANEMILSLNQVLRYSISEQFEYSQIKDDINYLKHYLKIYEIRFEELNYVIRVEEKLAKIEIPKLLLLPIIENSLKYGLIKRKDLQLLIEIKQLDNGNVVLSVADNGGGIVKEIVEKVNQESYQNKGNHHGLYNSKRRFLLRYPNSQFTLFSEFEESAVIMEIKQEDLTNV